MINLILLLALISLCFLIGVFLFIPRFPSPAAKKENKIPVLHALDNNLIECESGVFSVVELRGKSIAFLPENQQGHEKEKRIRLLSNTLPKSAVLYSYRVRDPLSSITTSTFQNAASKLVDSEWMSLVKNLCWKDSHYLVVYLPYGIAKFSNVNDEKSHIIESLKQTTAQIFEDFIDYYPTILKYDDGLGNSPILQFLHRIINQEVVQKIVPTSGLSIKRFLSVPQTLFNKTRFTVFNGNNTNSTIVRLQDYDDYTATGLLAEVEALESSYILMQTFKPKEGALYVEKLNLEIGRRESMDDKAKTTLDELYDVRDKVASGKLSLGEHQLTLVLTDNDSKNLMQTVKRAIKSFKSQGIMARQEISAAVPLVYYSLCPGNISYLTRTSDITARNFASFFTLHSIPQQTSKKYFLGQPETVLPTPLGTAKEVSLYDHDVGNTIIIGSNGTGKTVLANFLASQMNKLNHRYYCVDLDKSSKVPIKYHGGSYIEVEPGVPFCNPLLLPNSEENRLFLLSFISLLVGGATHKEQNILDEALSHVLTMSSQYRTLSSLAESLKGVDDSDNSLYIRLLKWTKGKQFGWLFDNNKSIEFDPNVSYYGFDTTYAYKVDEITAPIAFLVFHLIEQDTARNSAPFTIMMEELWRALDNEYTAYKVKNYEKTQRKQLGRLIVVTQDPEDIAQCSIGKAIVNQTATWFIYPGDSQDETYRYIGLTDEDIALLRAIPARTRQFLYKNGSTISVPLIFNYLGNRTLDTVFACNKERVAILESILTTKPTNWYRDYEEAIYKND